MSLPNIALMAYSRGKAPVLMTLGLAVAIALSLILWAMSGPYTDVFPRSFNSARWKAADLASDTRCGMILDLTIRIGIAGKTEGELTSMLGAPEESRNGPLSSYWLLCPSFLDVWVLDVRWQNGRAMSATIHDT